MNISPQQIAAAANAGIVLLNRDSTLVPGSLRKQLDLLEALLQGVARGSLVIQEPVLESDTPDAPDAPEAPEKSDDIEKEETPCE